MTVSKERYYLTHEQMLRVSEKRVVIFFKGSFLASTQEPVFVANSWLLLMLVISSLTQSREIDIDVLIKLLGRANKTFSQNADLLL